MLSVTFGLVSILPMGRLPTAAVGLTAQVADTMAWSFEDRCTATQHFSDWQKNPCGNITQPQPSGGSKVSYCEGSHLPAEAARIFDTMNDIFEMGSSFASAPKLFAGAGKKWPPPFAKGSGNLGDTLDFINGLSNLPFDAQCASK